VLPSELPSERSRHDEFAIERLLHDEKGARRGYPRLALRRRGEGCPQKAAGETGWEFDVNGCP
jgi:hypothetical protein